MAFALGKVMGNVFFFDRMKFTALYQYMKDSKGFTTFVAHRWVTTGQKMCMCTVFASYL